MVQNRSWIVIYNLQAGTDWFGLIFIELSIFDRFFDVGSPKYLGTFAAEFCN
jgi:hypothetical protein